MITICSRAVSVEDSRLFARGRKQINLCVYRLVTIAFLLTRREETHTCSLRAYIIHYWQKADT